MPEIDSKKRKRDASPTRTTLLLSNSSDSGPGPVLANFPSIQPPQSTSFKCYVEKKLKKRKDSGLDDGVRMILAGETPSVEFFTNDSETQRAEKSGCRYIVAIHHRSTSTTKLLSSTRPPHVLARTVKALKSIPPAAAPTALAYREARTALGETFGTKKAKAAIRAQERNKVNVSAMQGVMDHVMEGIEKGAEGLPTHEEAKDVADANRLVPPYSSTAADPGDVYPLHEIISKTEWKAIDVSKFDTAPDAYARRAWMPVNRILNWREGHLKSLAARDTGKDKRKILRILYYISAMMHLRQLTEHKGPLEKDTVYEKMTNVPVPIIDGLLERFTEVERGASTLHRSTSTTQTKLLTYMFALCLRVDGFATDAGPLANDLSLPVTKVTQMLRSLGCTMKKLSDKERAKLGLSDSYSDTKFAVLTAPVKFPKLRTGKKH